MAHLKQCHSGALDRRAKRAGPDGAFAAYIDHAQFLVRLRSIEQVVVAAKALGSMVACTHSRATVRRSRALASTTQRAKGRKKERTVRTRESLRQVYPTCHWLSSLFAEG